GARLKLFTVPAQPRVAFGQGRTTKGEVDDGLEARVPVTAGPHVVAATFVKDTVKTEDVLGIGIKQEAFFEGVGTLSIAGPYNAKGPGDTPSRRKIFICRPRDPQEEEACATRIITRVARRAYRRPINRDEIPGLMIPYKTGRQTGDFDEGVRLA